MNPKELVLPLPQILLDSIPFGIIVTDTSLQLTQVNHWVVTNTKINPQTAIGRSLGEVFPELAKRNLLEAYNLVLHGGMPLTLSNRIHRYFFDIPSRIPHQHEMPQNATITPVRSDNRLIGTITFITDVSERVNVETSLQREVDKLGALHEIDRAVSTLDLTECLQVIVRRTRALFNAKSAALYLFEQAKLQVASYDAQHQCALSPSYLAEWVAVNRKNRISTDLNSDIIPKTKKNGQIDNPECSVQCEMATPLLVHDDCIGVLNVQTGQAESNAQLDLDLLEAIASRAAIAIHNARLHASERTQRELAESMREISLTLAAELDLEAVLDAILKSVARVVSFDAACILLQENELLRVKRYLGFDLPNAPNPQTLLENYFKNSKLIQRMEISKLPEMKYEGIRNVLDLPTNLEQHLNTWAGAPIIMHGKLLGYLMLGKTETFAYEQDDADHLAIFASSAGIALENARSYSQQQNLAVTDGLTGLNNRRRFDDELNREMERVSRYKRPTSLVMMDIDNFKRYNDMYGHPSGDALLKRLAELLHKYTRDVDIVARYGGEEFAIIIPEVGLEATGLVAERIRKGVAGMHLTDEYKHLDAIMSAVTLSLGIASAPDQAQTPAELIHAADSALYLAKRSGKNKTVLFDLSNKNI